MGEAHPTMAHSAPRNALLMDALGQRTVEVVDTPTRSPYLSIRYLLKACRPEIGTARLTATLEC